MRTATRSPRLALGSCQERPAGARAAAHAVTHARRRSALFVHALLLVLGGCGRPAPPVAAAAPGGENVRTPAAVLAVVDVSVLPMTRDDAVLHHQTVVVRGTRIAALGPVGSIRVPRGATVVDGRGRYLLPGLADLHVHLEYSEDPATLAAFAAHGVTTVRSMDGRPYMLEWRRRIEAGTLLGPRLYTAGPLLDGDPPLLPDNTIVRTPGEARAIVATQDSAGYDAVKVYGNLDADVYDAIVDEARARGRPVVGHVPQAVGLEGALAAGQRSIEHLGDYATAVESDASPVRGRPHWSRRRLARRAHTLRRPPGAARLARAGVWAVPTIVQADRAIAPADSVRAWSAEPAMASVPPGLREGWAARVARAMQGVRAEEHAWLARGAAQRRAMTRALHGAGVPLLVGTDTPNPFVVPGASVHDELVNLVASGLTPMQAIAAATREAARFLGATGRWGTVQPGASADLLVIDADPRADIRATRRIQAVVLRGQLLDSATRARLMVDAAARGR